MASDKESLTVKELIMKLINLPYEAMNLEVVYDTPDAWWTVDTITIDSKENYVILSGKP